MEELRASMKILGFKAKHIPAIFSLLGNIEFIDSDAHEQPAQIVNFFVIMLGVHFEEFKLLYTVFLTAEYRPFMA